MRTKNPKRDFGSSQLRVGDEEILRFLQAAKINKMPSGSDDVNESKSAPVVKRETL